MEKKRVRKQKTDRQDAQLILKLMLKDDFPKIWVPSWENRDLRQTAMASPPYGAGAYADHESVASGGAERRSAVQEEVVADGTPLTAWNIAQPRAIQ
jgi:hypothetical protein